MPSLVNNDNWTGSALHIESCAARALRVIELRSLQCMRHGDARLHTMTAMALQFTSPFPTVRTFEWCLLGNNALNSHISEQDT